MKRWVDTLRQAVEALGDHRLRTALSVLGITIGIAAVMAVGAVSKGGNHIVFSELETFGLNSVWVYRDWAADPPGSRRREGSGLDTADYRAVADFDEAETVAEQVRARVQARHPIGYRYTSETMAGYIRTTNRILGGVALVGIVAASISLLVGGMGILNMMGTSVLERTREIGIRKAIGARESDIMRQFLLEAVLISVAGGLLGLALGGAASVVLARVTGFPLIPSPAAAVGALVVSMLVGVLSGYLPARRAARLPPVTALRSD